MGDEYPTLFVFTVSQNIPDIIDCNLKKNNAISIIIGRNIPDTTGHETTSQFSTSPNVCFCTIWENTSKIGDKMNKKSQ